MKRPLIELRFFVDSLVVAVVIPHSMTTRSENIEAVLAGLGSPELLLKMQWDIWLTMPAPYIETGFNSQEVTARYERNGYEWDIHGTLYVPHKERDSTRAVVVFHGGAGSERIMDRTPDGRPGLARILASQGFLTLSVTYPGHFPPGGIWTESVPARMPLYLFDRKLPEREVLDRNLRCTFNTILQGAALLTEQNLSGRDLLAFGHSTGGPMAASLHRFLKSARVTGLLGFGSGGPDGWRKEWRDRTGLEEYHEIPVEQISRRSPESFRAARYEDPKDLTPWGGPEEYMAWANPLRSQMKTSLCDNQHNAAVGILDRYVELTGLPRQEYYDHLEDPDPEWLEGIGVLLLVGENDKGHWVRGENLEDKREMFMGTKYAATTRRCHVILIPRYGHVGYAELYNEKIAYLWLWAVKEGFFDCGQRP